LSPGSSFDVMIDGIKAGTVELTPKTAAGGSAKFNLPKGFRGRDPMVLTFRAHLDVSPVECNRRPEDEPWLELSGDSTMEITPSRIQVRDLRHFNPLFLRDNFLRRAAFLVPRDFSLEELR